MTACTAKDLRAELSQRIVEVWRMGGVDPADVQIFGYDHSFRPRARACADLPEEDRWWANQASKLPSHKIEQSTLLSNWRARLTEAGYEVRRFRSSASETRVVLALHESDGVLVEAFVTADGNATLDVTMGPCATRKAVDPDSPYVPEP